MLIRRGLGTVGRIRDFSARLKSRSRSRGQGAPAERSDPRSIADCYRTASGAVTFPSRPSRFTEPACTYPDVEESGLQAHDNSGVVPKGLGIIKPRRDDISNISDVRFSP